MAIISHPRTRYKTIHLWKICWPCIKRYMISAVI